MKRSVQLVNIRTISVLKSRLWRWFTKTRRRKILSSILAVLILVSGIRFLFFRETKAAWYNTSWNYRQSISITNNASSATHTVMVAVDTYSLINAGKLQSDCDDLVFTKSDGTTVLAYYEDYCVNSASSGNSVIWVTYTSLPSGTTTMYMYYGNSGASDGTTTLSSNPTGISIGSGRDGALSVTSDTNINTANSGSRSCSNGGDAVNYSVTESRSSGTNQIVLSSTPASGCLAVGDEILIIRLNGLDDGVYETRRITNISTATLTLDRNIVNSYDGSGNKIMVQRVPNYTNVTLTNSGTDLIASAWDGTKGGILAFRANGTVTVNSGTTINTNSAGFTTTNVPQFLAGGNTGKGGGSGGGGGGGGANATAGGGGGGGGGGQGGSYGSSASLPAGGGGGGGPVDKTATQNRSGRGGLGGNGTPTSGGNGEQSGTIGGTGGGGGGGLGTTGSTPGSGGTATGTGTSGGSGGERSLGTVGQAGNGGAGIVSGSPNNGNNGGGSGLIFGNNANLTKLFLGTNGGLGGNGANGGNASGGNGAGSSGASTAGTGGGIVFISANTISVSGNIQSNGGNGNNGTAGSNGNTATMGGGGGGGGSGGGSGGSVLVKGISLSLGSSFVTATGGSGGTQGSGGSAGTASTNFVRGEGGTGSGGAGQCGRSGASGTCSSADSTASTGSASGGGGAGGAGTNGGNGRIHVDYTSSSPTTSPAADSTQLPYSSSPFGEESKPVIIETDTSHWNFDEGYGITTRESIGNVNNGTLTGTTTPSWQPEEMCVSGKCLYFQGTTAKVTLANNQNFKTVSMWVRPNDITSVALADFGNNIRITVSSGVISATGFTTPTIYVNGIAGNTLVANRWQHVAVVTNTTVEGSTIAFGVYSTTFLKGFMDEIRMNATALSADQVKAEFAARGSGEGISAQFGPNNSWLSDGLAGYWKMDETSNDAADSSGNGKTLTNNGATTFIGGKFGNGSEHVPASLQYFNLPVGSSSDTYYFDASDGGPTDPTIVWWDDSYAFNGSTSTYASTNTRGSLTNGYLMGEGTTAPSSGSTISDVEARIYGAAYYDSGSMALEGQIYSDGLTETLGTPTVSGSTATWGNYTTLSTPSGGWTWAKIQALEIKFYMSGFMDRVGQTAYAHIAQVKVNYSGVSSTISGVKSVSFWTNPDALTNYYLSLTSGAYITSNSSGVLSATGFDDPKIYVDGVPGNTIVADKWQYVTVTTETAINADQFYVGRVGSNYFDGTMDEVRLYNRVLSPTEVKSLYDWAPGPVAYWKLDEGSGTTVNDSSGNGNNSTTWTGNIKFIPGKYGSALTFDAVNSVVRITETSTTDLGGTNDSYTISAWIKTNVNFSGNAAIVAKDSGSGTHPYSLYLNSSEQACFAIAESPNTESVCGTVALNDNKWHHIVGIRREVRLSPFIYSYIEIYVDGVQVNNVALSLVTSGSNDADVSIGNSGTSYTTNDFQGIIDDVKIYNYARIPSQITSDMNAGHPAPGSPVGSALLHLKFDEGYGDTVNDSSPNKYTGTIYGATWTNNGKFGKALDFSGTDQYVLIPDDTALDLTGGEFSISAWINADGWGQNSQGRIIDNGGGSGSEGWSMHVVDTCTGGFAMQINNTGVFCATQGTLSFGTWYHVAATLKDGVLRLYKDGVEVGRHTSVPTPITEVGTIRIGIRNNDLLREFDGRIDEIVIYSFALSPEQMNVLANQSSASVWGATSTDSTGAASNAATDAYCPPGQTSSCTGPSLEWKLDENRGTTSVNDTSTAGLAGTMSGFTSSSWTAGKYGSALSFNGSSTHLSRAKPVNAYPFTLEAWVNTSASPGGNTTIVGLYDNATTNIYYDISMTSTGTVQARARNTTEYTATSTSTVNNGRWNHIVAVFTSATSRALYINGIQQATSTTAVNFNTAVDSLDAGRAYLSTPAQYFNGAIDNVVVYNYARTPAQVAWSYNRGAPTGWWKMDENVSGNSQTIYDSSGNGNNGTTNWGANTSGMDCTVTGKRNKACQFDGTDDYISLGTSNLFQCSATRGFSVSAWYKWASDPASDNNAVVARFEGTSDRDWMITNDYGWIRLTVATSAIASQDVYAQVDIPQNQWQHVVGVFDPTLSLQMIYIDGVLSNTRTLSTCYSGSGNQTFIGAVPYPTIIRYINGQIDDVRFYNYPVNAQQVKMVTNEGAMRFGN